LPPTFPARAAQRAALAVPFAPLRSLSDPAARRQDRFRLLCFPARERGCARTSRAQPEGRPGRWKTPAMEALTDDIVTLRGRRAAHRRCLFIHGDRSILSILPAHPGSLHPGRPEAYPRRAEELWDEGKRLPFAVADGETDALLGAIDLRLGEIGCTRLALPLGCDRRRRRAPQVNQAPRTATDSRRRHDPGHVASRRVTEKAGFVREGPPRSHIRFALARRPRVTSDRPPYVPVTSRERSSHGCRRACGG